VVFISGKLIVVGCRYSKIVLVFVAKVNAVSLTSIIGGTSIVVRIVVGLVSCKTGLVVGVRVAISASDKGYCKIGDFSIARIVS
jgi:hypothetical protein